jgi:hypothetical protein
MAGRTLVVQKPPTAQNYAIGCFGTITGNGPFAGSAGYIEGSNTDGLLPRSLYLEQLAQRLGGTPEPRFSPAGGTYTTAQTITLSATGNGALVRYTLDGSTPTPTTGTPYTAPFVVSTTTTVRAIAYLPGGTAGTVASATYTLTPTPPPVAPPPPTASGSGGGGGGSWGRIGALLLVALLIARSKCRHQK